MCFLLTVTLMTYCIRKASSGSCMMEICILSFLVILPILAVLTALYLLLPFFSENEEGGEQKRSATHKCEKSRIVGLLQRIYPDSDQLKFKCNMLNFGDNLGVVLTECFESGEPEIGYHFVTSKSSFWHENNTFHKIQNFNTISEDQRTITIMQVFPPLPEPCATEEDDNLGGEDNYFYVEHDFHPESEHILIGWQDSSRIAKEPYQEMPVTKKCQPNYPSAIIFTSVGRYFSGFQSVKCDEKDNFQESFIPYSIFLDQIHELYPNVEFKNNPPQQQAEPASAYESIGRKKVPLNNIKSSNRNASSLPSVRKQSSSITKSINTNTSLVVPNTYNALPLDKASDIFNSLSDATMERALNVKSNPDFQNNWKKEEEPTGTPIERSQHRADINSNQSMNYLKFCVTQFSYKAKCSNCKSIMSCCMQFNIPGCIPKVLKLCAACSAQPGVDMCCKEFIDLVKGEKFFPNRLFTEVATTTIFSKLTSKEKNNRIRENGVMAYKRSRNPAVYVIP